LHGLGYKGGLLLCSAVTRTDRNRSETGDTEFFSYTNLDAPSLDHVVHFHAGLPISFSASMSPMGLLSRALTTLLSIPASPSPKLPATVQLARWSVVRPGAATRRAGSMLG
ncbi:unnamed protein product, partial [Ectocarpus sp. 13 AM-2016]